MSEPLPHARHPAIATSDVDVILERAVQLIRARSDAVLNAVDDGIYVLDHQGHTIFANEAAVRMLGFTLREMLGQPQHELIHYAYADRTPFPVEDCPIFHSVQDGIYQRVGGDVFWRKDGRPLPVDYTSTPLKEGRRVVGAVITFRDISEHQLAQAQAARFASERAAREERDRALAEAREVRTLLENVFERAPVAITMTRGAEHQVVVANALARRLAGKGEMVGHTMHELFPELAGQSPIAMLDAVFATGRPIVVPRAHVRWRRDDIPEPQEGIFDIHAEPVCDAAGEVTGVLTYSTPVADSAGDDADG